MSRAALTGRDYRGCNILLLLSRHFASREWLTYKQTTGEDVKKFLDWGEENHVDVVELAKHGEENEFYEALEKCFGQGE